MPKGEEAKTRDEPPDGEMSGRQVYNVVSDTVGGVNVRLRDNVIQGLAIFVCAALGAIVGALLVKDRLGGAIGGGVIGLVVGLIGSGAFLMVYRAVMHICGRHD